MTQPQVHASLLMCNFVHLNVPHWFFVGMLLFQLCPTLCDPMDSSAPGSSVYGILQTRILEWVAIPSSRGSSESKD